MKKFLTLLLCILTVITTSCGTTNRSHDSDTATTTVPEKNKSPNEVNNIVPQNPPVAATFASYEHIVVMFRKIVECYPEYSQTAFENGIYDKMFFFPNNEAYEQYKLVFTAGYNHYLTVYGKGYLEDGRNSFGYTKYDLNKDGTDELILLNDRYDIIAIFSMKDGSPILLYAHSQFKDSWIDSEGMLHVKTDYKNAKVCVYSITDSIELELILETEKRAKLTEQSNFYYEYYKIQDGKETSITLDEWSCLFFGKNYPYNSNIMTYDNTDFDFIRLFGELNPQKPDYISWDWCEYPSFIGHEILIIEKITDNEIVFSLYYVGFNGTYSLRLKNISAERNGEKAVFDNGATSGSITFGLDCIWFTIYTSENTEVDCRTYFLAYYDSAKG